MLVPACCHSIAEASITEHVFVVALPSSSSGTEFAGLILQSPFTSILGLDPGHKFHVGVPDMFDSRRVLNNRMATRVS